MLKGQTSQWIDCPHCKQRTQTKSDTEAETMQLFVTPCSNSIHLDKSYDYSWKSNANKYHSVCGAILCLFCICLTCVPCCAGWFEKTNVSCSRCNKLVAIISSEGVTQVVPTTEQASQASQYAAPAPQQQPMVAKPQQWSFAQVNISATIVNSYRVKGGTSGAWRGKYIRIRYVPTTDEGRVWRGV